MSAAEPNGTVEVVYRAAPLAHLELAGARILGNLPERRVERDELAVHCAWGDAAGELSEPN